ncbi:MAG: 16S rRNA (cytosine(1402)-N(4))-methyltransferase RsmH [Burkholderiales bacterium]|nr:16S rRNA (cytosine(1402)-N(4))-methyltransferase RsmH [Burkholderiales bacterium]
MPEAAVDALAVRPGGFYVDCTFGRGGHSRLILARLGPEGHLVALDRDPAAVAAADAIRDPRFTIVHAGFARLGEVLDAAGRARADGILMDLGMSSPQIEDARRGFSFKRDGPLDMRMDTTRGQTAAQFLATATAGEIGEVLKNHGEERFAVQIAQAIVARRAERNLATTGELAALVADVVRARSRRPEPGQDPATRTFQALRIHVNQELEELQAGLEVALDRLAIGGRLAVISFHSLEDRLVKHAMRARSTPEEPPKGVPVRAADLPVAGFCLVGRAQRAPAAEVAANPRARSAILRVIERLA